ncbi:MAG: MBL fold metallo-hydrolase [Clostridiales bacterium]|nr:MBL fold metallo-hydrolase [Clostridiales bacterium]
MSDFRSEKITPSTTRIFTSTGEVCYLVEGSEKAVLIDAGLGLGDLGSFVKTLTQKPVELVLTHGHMDHAGGAPAFGEARISPLEMATLESHSDMGMRKRYAKLWLGKEPEDSDFVSGPVNWKPLSDKDAFGLGGVTLVFYALPGHTPGFLAPLNIEERWVLLGDACNVMTLLAEVPPIPIESVKHALAAFRDEHSAKFDKVYVSHGPGDLPKAVLQGVIDVCDDILGGRTDDVPFPFMGEMMSLAKAVNFQDMSRLDGGIGNILYRKQA